MLKYKGREILSMNPTAPEGMVSLVLQDNSTEKVKKSEITLDNSKGPKDGPVEKVGAADMSPAAADAVGHAHVGVKALQPGDLDPKTGNRVPYPVKAPVVK